MPRRYLAEAELLPRCRELLLLLLLLPQRLCERWRGRSHLLVVAPRPRTTRRVVTPTEDCRRVHRRIHLMPHSIRVLRRRVTHLQLLCGHAKAARTLNQLLKGIQTALAAHAALAALPVARPSARPAALRSVRRPWRGCTGRRFRGGIGRGGVSPAAVPISRRGPRRPPRRGVPWLPSRRRNSSVVGSLADADAPTAR